MNIKTTVGAAAAIIGAVLIKATGFGLGYVGGYEAVHAINGPSSIHDRLVANIRTVTVPKRIDNITTLTNVRVDDLQVIYTYQVNFDALADDAQATMTKRVCNEKGLTRAMPEGVSYRYEYWNQQTFVGALTVSSCPTV